jgi:hypothetical protein
MPLHELEREAFTGWEDAQITYQEYDVESCLCGSRFSAGCTFEPPSRTGGGANLYDTFGISRLLSSSLFCMDRGFDC